MSTNESRLVSINCSSAFTASSTGVEGSELQEKSKTAELIVIKIIFFILFFISVNI
jgi:hypothetical protein